MANILTRRALLTTGVVGSGLVLSGCDKLASSDGFNRFLGSAEGATEGWQRLIGRNALAHEFSEADISPVFKANGSTAPKDEAYLKHVEEGFANWRLKIDGLVTRPLSLSIADLRALPTRTQITRHDCVEGWSAIGKWRRAATRSAAQGSGAKAECALYCLPLRRQLRGRNIEGRRAVDRALLRERRPR